MKRRGFESLSVAAKPGVPRVPVYVYDQTIFPRARTLLITFKEFRARFLPARASLP